MEIFVKYSRMSKQLPKWLYRTRFDQPKLELSHIITIEVSNNAVFIFIFGFDATDC